MFHFVGHSRVYGHAAEIAELLEPLRDGTGFTGRAPAGKSRWTSKTRKMTRLDPTLVAKLSADHSTVVSSGTAPGAPTSHRDCTMDQI